METNKQKNNFKTTMLDIGIMMVCVCVVIEEHQSIPNHFFPNDWRRTLALKCNDDHPPIVLLLLLKILRPQEVIR